VKKSLYRFFAIAVAFTLALGNQYNAQASSSATGYVSVKASVYLDDLAATAITYYVSTTGNDSNPGTSASPFKTIQKAANTAQSGDSVSVLAGNYPERVTVNRGITFQAQGTVVTRGFTVNADNVTIRGFEITDTPGSGNTGWGIYLAGSNCVIEDNYIHYAIRGGIIIASSSVSNCQIRNNRLYRNSQMGMDIRGQYHLIEDNEIWGTIQYHPSWTNPPSWVDADGIHFFGTGHIFRGNYIHDILYSDPQNPTPHIDCFQTWADDPGDAANSITFEQNICDNMQSLSQNKNGHGFMLEGGVHHLYIKNNILKAYMGINTAGTGNAHHLYIYNNLFMSSLSFTSFWPSGVDLYDATNTIVNNNIFYNQPHHTITTLGDKTGQNLDYNLAYNSNGSVPPCIKMDTFDCISPTPIHNKWNVDPKFVNPSAGDYHLQAGSPAIGAGADGADIGVYGLPTITLPPPAATPLTPTGSIGSTYNPPYTWNHIASATWYYLWVNGPSGSVIQKWYEASSICNAETCSVTTGTVLGGGAHTWWLQTWNSAGYGPWSTGISFSTSTLSTPSIATLVSPTGNIGTNFSPSFIWNAVSSATYYYLYVSGPSGKVLDKWYETSTICSSGTCTVVAPTTLGGGNFTWWVQTWNSAGYGPWSTGMSFSTSVPTVPGAATLISPISGTTATNAPTYSWNQVSNATWYYLWVNGSNGNVIKQWYSSAQANCNGATCSVTPPTSLSTGTYTWWVQTWNSIGYGSWSTGASFTTPAPSAPGIATLISPISGTVGTSTPTYSWNQVSGATWYYLWVNGPNGNVIQQWYSSTQAGCNGTTCSVTPSTALSAGTYSWWIQSWNSAGYSPWSSAASFAR
jgi:parallel beta-helix repeat protein